jgi:hypothetical protein
MARGGTVGMRKQAPQRGMQVRQRLWRSMRMLRQFSVPDLEATAEAERSHIGVFIRALVAAGYVQVEQPRQNGKRGGHAVYRLIRNTGPVAPRLATDGLYDANLIDPYELPPTKRLCKHAHALHKCLRELLDAMSMDGDVDAALANCGDVLIRCDGGRS